MKPEFEGAYARAENKLRNENPHRIRTNEGKSWLAGWLWMDQAINRELGRILASGPKLPQDT